MTQSYNLRDIILAVDWIFGQNEFEANTGTGTAAQDTETIAPGGLICWIWTTPAGEPNSANWPAASGGDPYELVIDVSAMGADLLLNPGAQNTFIRVSADGATPLAGIQGTWDSTVGTGLKTHTHTTWDPAAGSATDRFGFRCDVDNVNTMGKSADITIQNLNTTTVYMKGPWGSAAAAPQIARQTPYPQLLAH